ILPLKGKILNVEKARFDKLLRSEEIKNMLTALGTGIGSEEYDIDKIKYHKVIIMTDADVDGSHIRTLLLTFFYRQMPEIIDRGYLYIAQPPLFRVGKGKNAIYLKDEHEYMDYLLERVCDNARLTLDDGAEEFTGRELYMFISNLAEYFTVLTRLEKHGIYSELVELMIKSGVEDKEFLQSEERMAALREIMMENGYEASDYQWNPERNVYEMMVTSTQQDILNQVFKDQTARNRIPVKIGRGLVYSTDFQTALVLYKKILKYDRPPFSIHKTDKESKPIQVESKETLINQMLEDGKKGLSIQRYKGLGEMNPDQLWETTMAPETRILLQVRVENIVDTDDTFTILMGDEVEPRRNFIQSNALEVNTLDI
ncbi:MAG: toprim domain-containing protein, partial [Desulfobacterales bacterium]